MGDGTSSDEQKDVKGLSSLTNSLRGSFCNFVCGI